MRVYWQIHPIRMTRLADMASFAGANFIHRNSWKYQGWLNGFNGGPLRLPVMKITDAAAHRLRDAMIKAGTIPSDTTRRRRASSSWAEPGVTLLLKHEEVVDLLTLDETIAAVRAGLVEQAAGEVQVPPRTTTDAASGHGWLRLMPAILNRSGLMGYKAMHSTPGVGVRYLVALYDLKSGELLAQMDADWLTSRRTAATAAVATDVLARPALGAGRPARLQRAGAGAARRALAGPQAAARQGVQPHARQPGGLRRRDGRTARDSDGARGVGRGRRARQRSRGLRDPGRTRASAIRRVARAGAHVTAISAVRPEARELDEQVWARAAVRAVDDRVARTRIGRWPRRAGQRRRSRRRPGRAMGADRRAACRPPASRRGDRVQVGGHGAPGTSRWPRRSTVARASRAAASRSATSRTPAASGRHLIATVCAQR